METEIVKGFVATNDVVPAYGGVQLPDEMLQEMAVVLKEGKLPFLAEHDPLRPVDAKILVSEVRKTESGSLGVWVEAEVPLGSMDGMAGFSYGASVIAYRVGDSEAPVVGLFAEPSRVSESEIAEAADILAKKGLRVEAGPYLQFSIDPGVVIVLAIGLEILVSVGGSAIWDAIKSLVHPKKDTEMRIQVEKPSGEKVSALVRTNDPQVAEKALQTLGPAVQDAVKLSYQEGRWRDLGAASQAPDESGKA